MDSKNKWHMRPFHHLIMTGGHADDILFCPACFAPERSILEKRGNRAYEDFMNGFFLVVPDGVTGASLRCNPGRLSGNFALATLVVNIVGVFLPGVLVAFSIVRYWPENAPFRLFASIGLPGAFSTFSAFSRETVHMLMAGETGRALLYIATNTVGAIMTFASGLAVFRILSE